MAWIVVRSCAASIALALAGNAALGQTPQRRVQTNPTPETLRQYNATIVSRLEQLADQARASENPAFAVRAQAQAAALLWSQNPEQARSIYRRAFESLALNASPKTTEPAGRPPKSEGAALRPALTTSEKRQLRSELLNQITSHDPELAEELARELADSTELSKGACIDNSSPDCSSAAGGASATLGGPVAHTPREAAEQRELLMSAALQIVERDPQQAMAFAQLSVALGISPNLARLLTLLRNADAERADLLFSNALQRVQQSSPADLNDIHTLGTYIVSTVNSPSKKPVSKTLVLRFLNFAVTQVAQSESAPSQRDRRDESATLYFIGRQLADLSARYGTDRLDRVRSYLTDASDGLAYDPPVDPDLLKVKSPGDIAREAREAADETQRDSLYARAAIAWLTDGDVKEAQAAALRVTDVATRDRVLVPVSRRFASEKRIEDAIDVARRVSDVTARADLLVLSSNAAIASGDKARAVELLNEAESCSMKASPSVDRAQALIKTASSFSIIDSVRSFEVLESAVKAINEIIKQGPKDHQADIASRTKSAQPVTLDELCTASFENTLAELARVDFERALILAQQLAGDEAPVIAQLAVLRGGLADMPGSEAALEGDGSDSSVNH
ncbi:MAG TPA: hypothetical protein VLM38_15510 [Blastocatellia bacterium]|nr:hypothetical protein [Blastocatellia bacterium]